MRLPVCSLVVSALFLAASAAAAQTTCGDVTPAGECQGDTALWCLGGDLQTLTCNSLSSDAGGTSAGTCADISNGGWGAWCLVNEGDGCWDSALNTSYACTRDGVAVDFEQACDKRSGCASVGFRFLDQLGACNFDSFLPNAPALFECIGSKLVVDCSPWGQTITLDCAADGGTCNGDLGICIMDRAGAFCDDHDAICGGDLICQAGACRPAEGEGEGGALGEGRMEEQTPPPKANDDGCSQTGSSATAVGSLMALVLLRRRRRR